MERVKEKVAHLKEEIASEEARFQSNNDKLNETKQILAEKGNFDNSLIFYPFSH